MRSLLPLILAAIVALPNAAEARTRRARSHLPLPLRRVAAMHHALRERVHARIRSVIQTEPVYEALYRGAPVRPPQPRPYPGDHLEERDDLRVAYIAPRNVRPAMPLDDAEQDEILPQEEDDGIVERGGARPTVAGSRAVLRNGIAYAPARAPESVKNAIWAANSLRRKPYVFGGGHGSFNDRGYDCSGTISFALHHAGVLGSPIPSSEFMRFGERGRGRWFTIYARPGHTFAVIAGLRLDTTDFNRGGNVGPRWHVEGRDTFGYTARHPVGL